MKEDLSKYSEDEARRIAYLIRGFLFHTLTEKEHDELDEWVGASDENMLLFEKLTDPKVVKEAANWYEEDLLENAMENKGNKKVVKQLRGKVRIWQWVAAACVLITIGVLAYVFATSNNDNPNTVIVNNSEDIQPASEKASLDLGNGKIVTLDGTKTDSTIGESLVLHRKDGEIDYSNA